MPKSQYLKDLELGLFRNASITAFASIQVALFRADNTEVSTSGTGYARQTIATNNTTAFTAPANGTGTRRQITNTAVVNFGTATGTWSTDANRINQVRVYDAGGTNLLHTSFADASGVAISKIVETGDSFTVPVNQLVLFESDGT